MEQALLPVDSDDDDDSPTPAYDSDDDAATADAPDSAAEDSKSSIAEQQKVEEPSRAAAAYAAASRALQGSRCHSRTAEQVMPSGAYYAQLHGELNGPLTPAQAAAWQGSKPVLDWLRDAAARDAVSVSSVKTQTGMHY